MKHTSLFIAAVSALLSLSSVAGEPAPHESWTQLVDSGDQHYSLSYDPGLSQFEVLNLGDQGLNLPELKLSLHRKNAAPLDLKLEALQKPDQPLRYLGQFRQWDASVTGVQLEMSFDKKTWKRVGRFFKLDGR